MPIRNANQGLTDVSFLTELQPRQLNLLETMGLFSTSNESFTHFQAERIINGVDAIVHKERGGERQYMDRESVQEESFKIPFFPLDGIAKASDAQDFRKYGTPDTPQKVKDRVEAYITRAHKSHANHLRAAMYTAITAGTTYAGAGFTTANSQYVVNYATVWGVTRPAAVALDLTAATNPLVTLERNVIEPLITAAQDQADEYEVIVLCGSGVFNSYTQHAQVQEDIINSKDESKAYRDRLGGSKIGRVFVHGNITIIEDKSGNIARGDAYALPLGIDDMFKVHYAPADHKDYVNTEAEEMYVFLKDDDRHDKVETETSFVCVNNRPELVYELNVTLQAGM
ncbi:MAG: hypothetical protein GY928_13210 [Colwellia sp.]|nr:hypothetical protein [Colwellia sp.]